MPPTATHDSSALHWNTGAWFGVQVGCTCWLLTGAAQLFPEAPLMSFVWLGTFLLANGLGVALWQQRQLLPMYRALQFFLLGLMVLSYGSMVAADWSGHLTSLVAGSPNARWIAYGALLIIPGLMVYFYFWSVLGVQDRKQAEQGASPDRGPLSGS